MVPRKILATATAVAAATASTVALAMSGSANAYDNGDAFRAYGQGRFVALNSSGVTGKAEVFVKGNRATVEYLARGLSPNLPHAAHLHFSPDARHECPTILDDTNNDFIVNTVEGVPAYGTVQKSLTVTGDTSPASALALPRFRVASSEGKLYYRRTIAVTDQQARAVKRGEVALVVHGIDYNGNGAYDFESAGASPLDPAVPAEATNPAACTIL